MNKDKTSSNPRTVRTAFLTIKQNVVTLLGKQQHIYLTCCEVFGEDFSWRWFFPLSPTKQLTDQFQQMCNDTLDLLEKADKAVRVLLQERRKESS